MSYVHDNPGGTEAHGVDLVDGDAPAIRILVHGDLPTTIEHEGRTWLATGDAHDLPPARAQEARRRLSDTRTGSGHHCASCHGIHAIGPLRHRTAARCYGPCPHRLSVSEAVPTLAAGRGDRPASRS